MNNHLRRFSCTFLYYNCPQFAGEFRDRHLLQRSHHVVFVVLWSLVCLPAALEPRNAVWRAALCRTGAQWVYSDRFRTATSSRQCDHFLMSPHSTGRTRSAENDYVDGWRPALFRWKQPLALLVARSGPRVRQREPHAVLLLPPLAGHHRPH